MDKVTILMATYNRAEFFLPRAIQSVLNQTYSDWKLIVGDNASTDNTEEVVASFKDKRILYTKNKVNTGTACTFYNRSLPEYETKYMAFLDDDNMFYPKHIEKLICKAEQGYDAVYCWAMNVLYNEGYIPIGGYPRGREWDKNLFMFASSYGNWIDMSDILADREMLISVGGFSGGFYDYAIMAKLCMKYGVTIGCVPEVLTECAIQISKYGEKANRDTKWRNSDTLLEHMNIY